MSYCVPVNNTRKFDSSYLWRFVKRFFIHKRVLIIELSMSENLYILPSLNLKCSISPFHRQFRGNYQEKIDLSYEDDIQTLPCKPRIHEVFSGIIRSTPISHFVWQGLWPLIISSGNLKNTYSPSYIPRRLTGNCNHGNENEKSTCSHTSRSVESRSRHERQAYRWKWRIW